MQTFDPTQVMLFGLWEIRWLLAFSATGFIALACFRIFSSRIKGWAGEKAVRRALDKGGFKHLHDLYLPSRDGVTQIDHVAMVGRAIVVVETKNYAGWILGDANSPTWRQCLAGGRVKVPFQSPIRQNHGHIKAVQAIVGPGVEVQGLVVFTQRAHFPKGLPKGVIQTDGLKGWLAQCSQTSSGSAALAWKTLEEYVGKTNRKAAKVVHKATVEKAKAGRR